MALNLDIMQKKTVNMFVNKLIKKSESKVNGGVPRIKRPGQV